MGYGTSTALSLLGEILDVLLPILIGIAIIAIVVGFFKDKINAIFCAIMGLAGIVFCIILTTQGFDAEMAVDFRENDGSWWCLLCALVLHVLMVVRYLPCLSFTTEKSTYLILGTLIEEKETFLTGLGSVLITPFVYSVPFYFLSLFILDVGFFAFHYVVFTILLIHSIVGFVRSCFYY